MNHSFDNQYTLLNILSKTSVKENNDVMRNPHYVKYESYCVTNFAERKYYFDSSPCRGLSSRGNRTV